MNGEDGMTLVYVPAGEFTMGSENGNDDEKPVHQVYLGAFWIDQTEVTNAMYAECVADDGCTPPSSSRSSTRSSYFRSSEFEDYPVIYVDWNQAKAYCEWAGRSLPTEAQWEKAARGTDGRPYPWGELSDCSRANYSNCKGDTVKAGSYESGKSPYDVYEMFGNVGEWVASLSFGYPYSLTDGREDLNVSGNRVRRGGSWYSSWDAGEGDGFYLDEVSYRYWVWKRIWIEYPLHVSFRSGADPSFTASYIGFRCALSQP